MAATYAIEPIRGERDNDPAITSMMEDAWLAVHGEPLAPLPAKVIGWRLAAGAAARWRTSRTARVRRWGRGLCRSAGRRRRVATTARRQQPRCVHHSRHAGLAAHGVGSRLPPPHQPARVLSARHTATTTRPASRALWFMGGQEVNPEPLLPFVGLCPVFSLQSSIGRTYWAMTFRSRITTYE